MLLNNALPMLSDKIYVEKEKMSAIEAFGIAIQRLVRLPAELELGLV